MTKKILAMLLVVITIISCVAAPASAATRSSGTNTVTITVITKGNWCYPGSESITLSQSKGTFTYAKTNFWGRPTGKTGTKTAYGAWNITIRATDGSDYDTEYWNDGSIKLKLKPNKTYTITISYDHNAELFTSLNYRSFRWKKLPSWRVSGTWKVSNYY